MTDPGRQGNTVALFGGSFNPPHVGHQMVALYVLETQLVDELWLVPASAHPFGKELASFADRAAMCDLAAAALGARVKVSRVEEELAARPDFVASRTLDTIEELARRAPATRWRLVIGADILDETHKWWRWDDVARIADPIVVARGGFALPGGAGIVMPDVSSSRVRELLEQRRDEDLERLLPRSVLRYIDDHSLYR
jgi:nicotinate-nucleotide adenylyltransferase